MHSWLWLQAAERGVGAAIHRKAFEVLKKEAEVAFSAAEPCIVQTAEALAHQQAAETGWEAAQDRVRLLTLKEGPSPP